MFVILAVLAVFVAVGWWSRQPYDAAATGWRRRLAFLQAGSPSGRRYIRHAQQHPIRHLLALGTTFFVVSLVQRWPGDDAVAWLMTVAISYGLWGGLLTATARRDERFMRIDPLDRRAWRERRAAGGSRS